MASAGMSPAGKEGVKESLVQLFIDELPDRPALRLVKGGIAAEHKSAFGGEESIKRLRSLLKSKHLIEVFESNYPPLGGSVSRKRVVLSRRWTPSGFLRRGIEPSIVCFHGKWSVEDGVTYLRGGYLMASRFMALFVWAAVILACLASASGPADHQRVAATILILALVPAPCIFFLLNWRGKAHMVWMDKHIDNCLSGATGAARAPDQQGAATQP